MLKMYRLIGEGGGDVGAEVGGVEDAKEGLRSFKVAWTTSTRPGCQLTSLAHK
jgi:hypothetical protein